ncbi:hypothetical protein GB882_12145 [Georgenia ruanii]|uniref:Uncharacterized protein n=1 Tax=Georgenia ruanii TaxID=348442 RepID=A0A7J9UZW4_9MICO|nr:hypothetical protein [Georgenia ruanii]
MAVTSATATSRPTPVCSGAGAAPPSSALVSAASPGSVVPPGSAVSSGAAAPPGSAAPAG